MAPQSYQALRSYQVSDGVAVLSDFIQGLITIETIAIVEDDGDVPQIEFYANSDEFHGRARIVLERLVEIANDG